MSTHKPNPEDYEGAGRTLPGAVPSPRLVPPLPEKPAVKDDDLPKVSTGGGSFMLPSFSEAEWRDWE